MKLYWSGTTRYHDWFANKNEIPIDISKKAKTIKIFENVEWFYEGIDEEKKKLTANDFDVIEYLTKVKKKKNGSFCTNIGSSVPFKWEANFLIFPYVASLNQIRGINIFNFYFEDDYFRTDTGSNLLAETFKKVNTIDNTEFAFIHPYKRYSQLTNSLEGEYQSPLTFGPMFSGVFWIIFLGEEHLKFFDTSKLHNLSCFEQKWVKNDKGLYIRLTKNISESIKKETEEKMFLLTEHFRGALK